MADQGRSSRASWSRVRPSGGPTRPPALRTLLRGLSKRCPNCGSGHLFRRYFTMVERCPRCGLRFHRQEGQWSGDIGANTIVTFFLLWVVLVIGSLVTWNDPNLALLAGLSLAIVVVFPAFFVPHAKTLWVAVDILMRPVEPDELDPEAAVPAGHAGPDDRTHPDRRAGAA